MQRYSRRGVPSIVKGNRRLLLSAQVATALAELMTNAKTVLPWLLQAMGAPVWIIGWLVPIRESGAMLPQIIWGAYVRQFPQRRGLGCGERAFTSLVYY